MISFENLSAQVNQLQAAGSALATEAFSNIRTVRSFNAEALEQQLFDDQLERTSEKKRLLALSTSAFYICLVFGVRVIALSTIFLGGYLVSQEEISRGDIAAIVTQTQMIQRCFAGISMIISKLSKAMKNAENIFTVLDLQPQVHLLEDLKDFNDSRALGVSEDLQISSINNEVELSKVRFSYPSRRDITVLKDFDLSIKKGEVVALVGPSGSGKSTVFALLQKFYLPDDGIVSVNGRNVKEINPSELYSLVSTVSQEPVLFARSILENIRYGKPDAKMHEIIEAAKKANAHEFISQFPEGYNTMLGERGALLSGGQKQRIAIARAILADSKILLLDEATSALDNRSEKKVQQALQELMKGRTTIIIAHRLSTIQDADKIYVPTSFLSCT